MKLTTNRNFETSKVLETKAAQETGIKDFIQFCSDAFSQIISALRNGLSFEDNMRCFSQQVDLTTGVGQEINTNGKTPLHAWISKPSYAYPLKSFGWKINDNGKLQVIATMDNSPTAPVTLTMLIFY